MKMPSTDELQHFFDLGLNVLFKGRHGVGKTMAVKTLFDKVCGEQGKKWLYLSASTLDPHIHLVGIPRPIKKNGQDTFEMILPEYLANEQVEAIFIDEYNRARESVRNAVMELVQFRSINGRKLPNLKVVWAAINPPDENYDVQVLDPAQLDRFIVQISLDFDIDDEYFISKFGLGIRPVLDHWRTIDPKDRCSPRRYEAAIIAHQNKVPASLLLGPEMNIPKFLAAFDSTSYRDQLDNLLTKSDAEIKKFFSKDNNIERSKQFMMEKPEYLMKFGPHIHREKIGKIFAPDVKTVKELLPKVTDPSVMEMFVSIAQIKICPPDVRNEINTYKEKWVTEGHIKAS